MGDSFDLSQGILGKLGALETWIEYAQFYFSYRL